MTTSDGTGSPEPGRLIHSCLTKGTVAEGQNIRRALSWLTSRRAKLEVRSDSLVCGDWTIPYAELEEAVLFLSRQMFIVPVYVLRVRASGRIYQFGLNSSPFWKGELPFPVRREKLRLGWSPFSIAVRAVLALAVGYWIWRRFF